MRFIFLVFCFFAGKVVAQPVLKFPIKPSNSPSLDIKARIIEMPASFSRDIRIIAQDEDGYIWFSTNQGIWRFDGTDAKQLDYRKFGFPQNLVPEYLYCFEHFLAAYYLNTIYIYDEREDRHFVYHIPFPVVCFDEEPGGALFFLTQDGQAWRFTRKTLLQKSFSLHYFSGWSDLTGIARTLFDNSSGQMYLFLRDHVGRPEKNNTITWSADTALVPLSPGEPPLGYVRNCFCTSRYLLAEYVEGFVIYDKQTLAKIYEYRGYDFACALKKDDQLVLPARKPGVMPVLRPSNAFSIQEALFNDTIASNAKVCARDPEKIWISTSLGLAEVLLHGGTVFPGSRQTGLIDYFRHKSVRSVFRYGDTLYVGTYEGFYSCDRTGVHFLFREIVFTMKPAGDHRLLLGLEGGTGFMLLDLRTQQHQFITHKCGTIYTRAIFPEGDHYLAAGFNEIVRVSPHVSPQAWSVDTVVRDNTLGIALELARVRGEVWVACETGVYRMDKEGPDRKPHLTKIFPRNGSLMVYSIQETSNGIWLATQGKGLVKIDGAGNTLREIGFNEGLSGDFVYSMQFIDGLLVAGTNAGLSIFDTTGGMRAIPLREDDKQNGYSRQELNHSALFYDSAGQQLIMGGLQGLLFADLSYYRANAGSKQDRLLLSYAKEATKGTERPDADLFAGLNGNITLLPEDVYVGLKFGCPQIPGDKQALFRIHGLDDKWQKINTAQEISLYALPPGNYTLEARWPSDPDQSRWFSKILIVRPHFYQTLVFRIGLGLLAVFIIYLVWRARLKKLKDSQQLRTTIASDLHDEIGGTLARISLNCELLLIDRQHETARLQSVSEESKKAIASISDIIWSIDARNDTRDDLILRMQEHATLALEDKALDLHIRGSGLNAGQAIPQAVRQNIYLIFKEAISNIVRHNERPEVWITFDNGDPGFSMEIKNTVDRPRPQTTYSGQGLKNMKMRAERIRAAITVERSADVFTVRVEVKKTRRVFKR